MNKIVEIYASLELKEYIELFRDVDKFIGFCQECNSYGKTWACPPFGEQLDLNQWNYANIFGTKIFIGDTEQSQELEPAALRDTTQSILDPIRESLDKRVLEMESKTEGSRALFAGSCKGCKVSECTRPSGEACSKPHLMRPSLEALGFDVGKTTSQLLGIELKWSSRSLPEYFTLVYALFTKEPFASYNAISIDFLTNIDLQKSQRSLNL